MFFLWCLFSADSAAVTEEGAETHESQLPFTEIDGLFPLSSAEHRCDSCHLAAESCTQQLDYGLWPSPLFAWILFYHTVSC